MPQQAYDAEEVANYFIERAQQEGARLTPMKLLKLAYFAQGWHLAIEGEELIRDPVEAWDYGPVIPSLYHSVKRYGDRPITEKLGESGWFSSPEEASPGGDTREVLDAVWDVYSKYEPQVLSDITHMPGTPWHQVNEKYDGNIPRHVDIPNDLIREYFEEKLDVEDKPDAAHV